MTDFNMNNYCVYVHHNNINGKRYVGITNNPKKRWYGNGKDYADCKHFASAIKKYGWNNFTHYLLEDGLTLEQASALEQMYIARYKTQDREYGYNILAGGQNRPSMLGKHHSEETKRKMSASQKGRTQTAEWRANHSAFMMGLLVGERNGKSTPVECITTGEVFATQREAAKATGCEQSKISLCCNGKRNHTHGLKWRYANKGE